MASVSRVAIAAPLLALSIALSPGMSAAQNDEGDGYSFRAPKGSISARLGFAKANAKSEVFEDARKFFTLDRGDFSSPTLAIEAGFFMNSRTELLLGVTVASRTAESNYRAYVDNDDREIEQSTTFRRVPLTFGLRYFVIPIGKRIGSYAWVPSNFAPYVSAGGGMVYYRFQQEGDFVDFVSLDVYPDEQWSDAWAPTVYGAIGAHYSLTSRTALATELRYDVAKAPMDFSFSLYDKIDLSGASLTVGFNIRL
jgi:outer membrane protein W